MADIEFSVVGRVVVVLVVVGVQSHFRIKPEIYKDYRILPGCNWMLIGCSSDAHWMLIRFSLGAHWMLMDDYRMLI